MTDKTSIKVEGMTCQNCVKHVTTELVDAGASDVTVDLVTGGVSTVEFNSAKGRALTPEEITHAIDEAGYKLVAMSIP